MKKSLPQPIGLRETANGHSAQELISGISGENYRQLVGFARLRLRAVTRSRWLQRCLAVTDAEDLVDQAILKLLLGERDPSLGRHLRPRNCVDMDAFMACVKGIINSDLNNTISAARNKYEHIFLGNPEEDGAIEPEDPQNASDLLSRRDLHRVFFKRLYARIENQPSLLIAVKDWEQRSLDDDLIGAPGLNRDHVYRVRQLAREVISELDTSISPALDRGKELSL